MFALLIDTGNARFTNGDEEGVEFDQMVHDAQLAYILRRAADRIQVGDYGDGPVEVVDSSAVPVGAFAVDLQVDAADVPLGMVRAFHVIGVNHPRGNDADVRRQEVWGLVEDSLPHEANVMVQTVVVR